MEKHAPLRFLVACCIIGVALVASADGSKSIDTSALLSDDECDADTGCVLELIQLRGQGNNVSNATAAIQMDANATDQDGTNLIANAKKLLSMMHLVERQMEHLMVMEIMAMILEPSVRSTLLAHVVFSTVIHLAVQLLASRASAFARKVGAFEMGGAYRPLQRPSRQILVAPARGWTVTNLVGKQLARKASAFANLAILLLQENVTTSLLQVAAVWSSTVTLTEGLQTAWKVLASASLVSSL
jgi:hypothetical protein